MENEGWDVARALANRGVAAFVLKYRLKPTPEDLDDFAAAIGRCWPDHVHRTGMTRPPRSAPWTRRSPTPAQRSRSCAAERRVDIDPERVGMVGFSAGAMLTVATALIGEDAKPAFIGDIYGPLTAFEVPADAPPLFIALPQTMACWTRAGSP